MSRKKPLLICAAALAAHFGMGLAFIRSAAPTCDEPVHLSTGYSTLVTGINASLLVGHPPLAEMAAVLPLLAYKPNVFSVHPYFRGSAINLYGDLFLYENRVSAEKLLNTARVFSLVLWSGLLAFFIWLFVSKAADPEAGVFSVAVFSLMPVFISNNALVTTDAAAATLFFGAFCFGYLFSSLPAEPASMPRHKSASVPAKLGHCSYAALTGLVTGLAMASKFSMFILPPLIIMFWIAHNLFEPKTRISKLLLYTAVYLAATLATLAFIYRLDISLYLTGVGNIMKKLDQVWYSFAWGERFVGGVWWYFPFALVVKTPLAILALAMAGLAAMKKSFRKDYLWLILPPLIYFAVSMTAKLQIGVRHILPVMPFLAALAGLGAAYAAKRKFLRYALAPLLLLWGWGLIRTGPYYLAYFNELAGGSSNGYNFLVDSNLDWGQDVKSLAALLKKEGNPPIMFCYFGTARPEYYGIKYVPVNAPLIGTGADVCRMDKLLLAVSATNLQGVNYADNNTFAWLKSRKSVASAGYSIFLYDLTSDKEGKAKLADLFDRNSMSREAACVRKRGV